nr:hypothetical protein [Tanacetum cinerariifolium]
MCRVYGIVPTVRNGYFCFYPYPGSYQIDPDRADSELEASVEGLFDEGGSGGGLREDHGTPSGASVGGKSRSALQRLLTEAVLNAKVGVAAIPTLPFVIAYKLVKPFLFSADSSSAGGADPNTGVFSDLTDNDFLVGGIRIFIDPDTDL